MMNQDNRIDIKSRLYGFIALNASKNRFSTVFNSTCKTDGVNAMMVPMNIREDDLFFTISNSKNSKLNGLMISYEYQEESVELLSHKSAVVEECSLCDYIVIKDALLHGEFLFSKVLIAMCKSLGFKNIAIIGANNYAKALLLEEHCFENIAIYDEFVENIMQISQASTKEVDINRLSDSLHVELDSYDMVFNFSTYKNFSMIKSRVKNCFEIDESPLKELCDNYIDYDRFLEYYVDEFYRVFNAE